MSATIAIRGRLPNAAEKTRVMVCLPSEPVGGLVLLQKAAHELSAGDSQVWLVHVETPTETKAAHQRSLSFEDMATLADSIGAELAWLKSADIPTALIDFAQRSKIDRIIVHTCRRRALWNRLFHRSIVQQLVDRARSVQIEIVGLPHLR